MGESDTPSSSLWLAPNPSKRWAELFFLGYTPFWLTLCLGIIIPYKLYERFTELEYLLLGLVAAVPSFVIPMLLVGKADSCLCWKDRYWVKASIWIIIFSYVGNYFWTHYFFTVLGASYTFPSWKMNNVPHTTFLLTHICFLFYHVTSNLMLRRIQNSVADLPPKIQWAMEAAWILALAYFIAYLETLAVANFPYYEFVDRASMYKVGSLFYAIYFIVSFPMFLRIDEKSGDQWDLPRVAVDALGAAMCNDPPHLMREARHIDRKGLPLEWEVRPHLLVPGELASQLPNCGSITDEQYSGWMNSPHMMNSPAHLCPTDAPPMLEMGYFAADLGGVTAET